MLHICLARWMDRLDAKDQESNQLTALREHSESQGIGASLPANALED